MIHIVFNVIFLCYEMFIFVHLKFGIVSSSYTDCMVVSIFINRFNFVYIMHFLTADEIFRPNSPRSEKKKDLLFCQFS